MNERQEKTREEKWQQKILRATIIAPIIIGILLEYTLNNKIENWEIILIYYFLVVCVVIGLWTINNMVLNKHLKIMGGLFVFRIVHNVEGKEKVIAVFRTKADAQTYIKALEIKENEIYYIQETGLNKNYAILN